jgi:hypothetical protein
MPTALKSILLVNDLINLSQKLAFNSATPNSDEYQIPISRRSIGYDLGGIVLGDVYSRLGTVSVLICILVTDTEIAMECKPERYNKAGG